MKLFTKSFFLFSVMLIADGCVDRLEFEAKETNLSQLVVDGLITDEEGPYTIRLFRSSNIDDNLRSALPFSAKAAFILDNTGNSHALIEEEPGIYKSDPNGLRGEIGNSYILRIEGRDGTIYQSEPQEILPVPDIDSVYYQFDSFKPLKGPTQYGFRVFMDANSGQQESKYLRWRFTGTYEVESFPALNHLLCNCCTMPGPPDPFPCSGVVWTGTFLKKVGDCTCCNGWVSDFESKPQLNDETISTGGLYKNVEVGYVPFTAWTFGHNKYMVKVEQMSLSREAYEFWKIIKDQKEGSSSLFQPAFGKVFTNITTSNLEKEVTGFFYASAIKKKVAFISGADATISIPDFDISPPESNCALWEPPTQVFDNASLTPPKEWN